MGIHSIGKTSQRRGIARRLFMSAVRKNTAENTKSEQKNGTKMIVKFQEENANRESEYRAIAIRLPAQAQ